MHSGGRLRVPCYEILKLACVSAFCNILQHCIGEIFDIPENVPRFLKNVFHIPDERQLGLPSLSWGSHVFH